jgi:hypothetical protein
VLIAWNELFIKYVLDGPRLPPFENKVIPLYTLDVAESLNIYNNSIIGIILFLFILYNKKGQINICPFYIILLDYFRNQHAVQLLD